MSVDFAFLDSGTGGIPYMLHLKEVCPSASCVYVGDTEHFPYGEKTHEEIVKYVTSCVQKIICKFDPKIIVIACNTMSVNSLDVLRDVFAENLFVGTVPAIKLASSVSKKRCIGLLATNSTVNHPYNQDLKNHFAADCKLVLRGDPELISYIEHESFTDSEEERMAACVPAVDFFKKQGCDAIILGCTHFLNLKNEMQKVAAPEIQVVDSVEGVTKRALSLHGGNFNAMEGTVPKSTLFVTGFSDKKDKKEYDVICNRYNIEFGGIL